MLSFDTGSGVDLRKYRPRSPNFFFKKEGQPGSSSTAQDVLSGGQFCPGKEAKRKRIRKLWMRFCYTLRQFTIYKKLLVSKPEFRIFAG
jgi:hypothetical protein